MLDRRHFWFVPKRCGFVFLFRNMFLQFEHFIDVKCQSSRRVVKDFSDAGRLHASISLQEVQQSIKQT